jgi:hypothetical protein
VAYGAFDETVCTAPLGPIGHNWCERDNKSKSRNSMTKEEVEYNKIDDRQRKRKVKKNKIDEVDDDNKEFLEWVDFYIESDKSRHVLKRRNSKFFTMCKAQCDNEKIEESDTDAEVEEKDSESEHADNISDSEK